MDGEIVLIGEYMEVGHQASNARQHYFCTTVDCLTNHVPVALYELDVLYIQGSVCQVHQILLVICPTLERLI